MRSKSAVGLLLGAWLLWLLPVGGLLIAAIYRLTKMENKNTNAIIDAI